MYELDVTEGHILKDIFHNCTDTVVWSFIQGYMGRGFTDNKEDPSLGMIICGDFCFLAGDYKLKEADDMIFYQPSGIDRKQLIYVGDTKEWNDKFKKTGEFHPLLRYAIKKEGDIFNRNKLQDYINQLPQKYSLKKINTEIYTKCMKEPWTAEFCSNFESSEDFLRNGIGYVILCNDEIIAGASSYSVYDEGIEIEIVTREDHRKKGLATVSGAKLILKCLESGKYPSWDAANKSSVALAVKLGYHYDKEYTVWMRNKHR